MSAPRPSAVAVRVFTDALHGELNRCPAARRVRGKLGVRTVRCHRPLGHAWDSPHPTGRVHTGVDAAGRRFRWPEPEEAP